MPHRSTPPLPWPQATWTTCWRIWTPDSRRPVSYTHLEQLRNFKTAITADGLLYQGYVVRSIQRKLMDDAFIGRRSINLRVSRLEEELTQIDEQLCYWEPIRRLLTQSKEPLFTHFFIQNTVAEKQKAYLRGMEITKEVTDIEDQLSKLDLLWLDEQRRTIAALGDEILSLIHICPTTSRASCWA